MSDTIRELIILDFVARGAVIRTGSPSNYHTDIGATVDRWRQHPIAPALNIWDRPEAGSKAYGMQKLTMPILIEGTAAYGNAKAAVIAGRILGDIIRAFMSPSWSRSPNYIDSIDYITGGTENYPDEEDLIVGAYALFHVAYTTQVGDPDTCGG